MIISDSEKQAQGQINDIKLKYGFDLAPAFIKKQSFQKLKRKS